MRIQPRDAAAQQDADDGVVYFCSARCAALFDADPTHRPSAHPS